MMKQLISIFLIVLLALSAVNMALADYADLEDEIVNIGEDYEDLLSLFESLEVEYDDALLEEEYDEVLEDILDELYDILDEVEELQEEYIEYLFDDIYDAFDEGEITEEEFDNLIENLETVEDNFQDLEFEVEGLIDEIEDLLYDAYDEFEDEIMDLEDYYLDLYDDYLDIIEEEDEDYVEEELMEVYEELGDLRDEIDDLFEDISDELDDGDLTEDEADALEASLDAIDEDAYSLIEIIIGIIYDEPEFEAIGDQIFYENTENVLEIYVTDNDDDLSSLSLVEDNYDSESSSYDEATHFSYNDYFGDFDASLQWAPDYTDIGDHILIFTAYDDFGYETTETFTITVLSQYEGDVEGMEDSLAYNEELLDEQIELFEDAVAEDDVEDLAEVDSALDAITYNLETLATLADTTLDEIDEANDGGELSDELTAELEDRIDTLFEGIMDLIETIEEMEAYFDNTAPSFIEIDHEIEINEDDPWVIGFIVEDADEETGLYFAAVETGHTSESSTLDLEDEDIFYIGSMYEDDPSMAEIVLEWTPTNDDVGAHYVTIVVSDSYGLEDSMEITITVNGVNDRPTIEEVPNLSVTVNTETEEVETLTYQLEVEDVDSEDFTYMLMMTAIDFGDAEMPMTPEAINSPAISDDNVLTWTPDISEAGYTFEVTIVAYDDYGDSSNLVSFEIYVNTQTAPMIEDIADQTLAVGDTLDLDITATDATNITLEASGLGNGAEFTDNGDGTADLTWTVTSEDVGTYTVTISATDEDSEVSTESFTITVQESEGAPVFGSVDDQTVMATEELVVSIEATDAEGNEITFSIEGLDEDAAAVETAGDAGSDTLTITWTPTESEVGDYEILVTATDAEGNAATASFTITVTEELSEWEQAIIDLEDQFEEIEINYQDDDLEDAYEDAVDDEDEDDIEDATEDLEDVLDELEDLMDDIDDLREDINDAEDDDEISSSEEDDLEEDLDDLEGDVQDLIDEIEHILGIDYSDSDGESAVEYTGETTTSTSSDEGDDDSDVEVETTFLEGDDTSNDDSTVTVESTSSFDEIRPLLWLSAGIVIAFALLIFALGLLLTKKN